MVANDSSSSAPKSFVQTADARVGRPLTPMSYAGVARRTTPSCCRRRCNDRRRLLFTMHVDCEQLRAGRETLLLESACARSQKSHPGAEMPVLGRSLFPRYCV